MRSFFANLGTSPHQLTMRDTTHPYAQDSRTSEELIELHREGLRRDDDREAMAILHFRGGETEFLLAKALTESADAEDRAIGADILAQLGWNDRTFLDESVSILISLLEDSDPHVISCAAVGLGHRGDSRAIAPLLRLTEHENPCVRFGVAFGLCGHDNDDAIATLITLSGDSDNETRNWAMFGIGTQIDTDTPEVRAALLKGLNDNEPEIRGEAMIGLARRGDLRCVDAILKELSGPFYGDWAVEAAEILGLPEFVPALEEQKSKLNAENRRRFELIFDRAIEACSAKRNKTEAPPDVP
jgi:HEAT repeat protein